MTNVDIRIQAMLSEISAQRDMLGSRAANFAAANAMLQAKVTELEKRVAELEAPPKP